VAEKGEKKEKGPKKFEDLVALKLSSYKVEGGALTRQRPACPKCGAGTFLAVHANRTSCGNCGYTEFKKA
jgi:small subunit ribosomal protein S27Ae